MTGAGLRGGRQRRGAIHGFNALNELTASTVGGVSLGYANAPAGRLIGAEDRFRGRRPVGRDGHSGPLSSRGW